MQICAHVFVWALVLVVPICGLAHGTGKVWENPCGTLTEEIFPEQVDPQHLPWVVRVGYEKKGRLQYECAGSLIDRHHVLTAAHCVQPGKIPTRIQIRNCDDGARCEGSPRNYGVEKISPHPEYSSLSASHVHDIAVIRLDRDVNLASSKMSAVCLPMGDLKPAAPLDGESDLVVAGWRIHMNGTKSTPGNGPLQTVSVPVVSAEDCQEHYKEVFKVQPEFQMCAGGEGSEPCRGDAGAPLHHLMGKRVVQVGLASFGLPECSNASLPTIYTNVQAHVQWIQDTVSTP